MRKSDKNNVSFSVYIDEQLLKKLDRCVKENKMPSRSFVIVRALREYLSIYPWFSEE